MTCEVIVDVQPKKIAIALTEDKRLVEYQEEELSASFNVGNIYLARVRKIMPGLNACFVNVGHEREAFLHYQDLGPQFNSFAKYIKQVSNDRKKLLPISKATIQPDLIKDGSIANLLQSGQEVLVQIVKEPISTKGPRLTCEITFPGRFLVLVPFTDKVHVSSKIKSSAERARLKQLISSIKPKNFGVIVRTVAEGKRVAELDSEMKVLVKRWEDTIAKAHHANDLPCLCYEETSRTVALLRDLFNPTYENIYINDLNVFEEVRTYVNLIAPECVEAVKLYKGKLPIFDNFDVTRQIKTSFGKTVSYKHGAYLIIEHTEALHVVDVNSGNRAKNPDGQEANALEVNLGAADELARQLRLRDMGGIIVVDFIDMKLAEDRQKLYERMCENMKRDRARHNILPLSKFGLMQITRQRVRPVTEVIVDETCPTCMGKGTIKSSFLFTDVLETKVDMLVNQLGVKSFTLHVHPYVAAYLNQGLISLRLKWQMKYGFGVRIMPNQRLAFLQYEFQTPDGQEIDMKTTDEMK
ncbi:MAG: Rne/Rng family ribonuclease [Bacteroidaceae bacterium]|nr:Rne/Rng family ribonuclease [Bacteroidaceae bacterium]